MSVVSIHSVNSMVALGSLRRCVLAQVGGPRMGPTCMQGSGIFPAWVTWALRPQAMSSQGVPQAPWLKHRSRTWPWNICRGGTPGESPGATGPLLVCKQLDRSRKKRRRGEAYRRRRHPTAVGRKGAAKLTGTSNPAAHTATPPMWSWSAVRMRNGRHGRRHRPQWCLGPSPD